MFAGDIQAGLEEFGRIVRRLECPSRGGCPAAVLPLSPAQLPQPRRARAGAAVGRHRPALPARHAARRSPWPSCASGSRTTNVDRPVRRGPLAEHPAGPRPDASDRDRRDQDRRWQRVKRLHQRAGRAARPRPRARPGRRDPLRPPAAAGAAARDVPEAHARRAASPARRRAPTPTSPPPSSWPSPPSPRAPASASSSSATATRTSATPRSRPASPSRTACRSTWSRWPPATATRTRCWSRRRGAAVDRAGRPAADPRAGPHATTRTPSTARSNCEQIERRARRRAGADRERPGRQRAAAAGRRAAAAGPERRSRSSSRGSGAAVRSPTRQVLQPLESMTRRPARSLHGLAGDRVAEQPGHARTSSPAASGGCCSSRTAARPASTHYLIEQLAGGRRVEVPRRSPSPATCCRPAKADLGVFLSNFDCVILANVPAEELTDDQQE